MQTNNQESEVITAHPEYSTIKAVPKEVANRFLKQFFSTLAGCSLGNVDGINIAIIPITSDENTQMNTINLKLIKDYNVFLKNEFGKDPKYFNRNMVYESEVKEDKIIIRWA
jgi:hypothetical protein